MSEKIHSTAIISSQAELGPDIEIGPYVIINDNVRIGAGTKLMANVYVDKFTEIGKNCVFFPYSSIGTLPQDLKYKPCTSYVKIGDGNTFREFVTINRATEPETITEIGNKNLFMAYSHVAHNCKVGNNCIFANVATLAGHVHVQDNVIIGGLSGIHQFCKLGSYSIIGGATPIRKDVLPYGTIQGDPAKVRGLNLIGLKRRGFSNDVIRELKEIYKVLFYSDLNTSQAIKKLGSEFEKTETLNEILDFINQSERGIVK